MPAPCRNTEPCTADRRALRSPRPRHVVKSQGTGPVRFGIGSVAIDGGAEDQIAAGNHRLMELDAVPVEAKFGTVRDEFAKQGERLPRNAVIHEAVPRFDIAG